MKVYEKPCAELIDFQSEERIMDLGGLGDLELQAIEISQGVDDDF